PQPKPKPEPPKPEPPKPKPPATQFQNCKADQVTQLRTAVATAIREAGSAISKLGIRPLPEDVRDALWFMFRTESVQMAEDAAARLGRIKSGLPTATVECEQPEDLGYSFFCEDLRGYVRKICTLLKIGNIHVCMGNWDETFGSHLFLHEGSHRFD